MTKLTAATGALAAILTTTLPLQAGDAWQDKPSASWTEKDVAKLRSKSPWAHQASTDVNADRMSGLYGQAGASGGSGRGSMGGGGGASVGGGMSAGPGVGGGSRDGGPPMGGGEPGTLAADNMAQRKVTVRWESAAALQAAPTKENDELHAKVAAWSKEFYVVTASGMGSPRRDASGDNPDRMSQMQNRLKTATVLRRKGKDPIYPTRVERLQTPEGPMTVFLFPRGPITLEDKEVQFETALGLMEIRTRFVLKDMSYQGKLEL